MVDHMHQDEKGVWHKCYHTCRDLSLSWKFWLGTFGAFFPEHIVWEKVPPFSYLTHWVGL